MTEEEKRKDNTREFIERLLNNYLKVDIFDHIKFVKKEYPLVDMRDVCLGYVIGVVAGKYECHCVLKGIKSDNSDTSTKKDIAIVMKALHEYLPRIIDKIETEFCE
jgi:hypothetical protein